MSLPGEGRRVSSLTAQAILSGLAFGLLYGVAASGFALVYGVMEILNFAHGDFIALGAYLALILVNASVPYPWMVGIVVLVVGFIFGAFVFLTIFFPLRRREPFAPMLASLALGVILVNGIGLIKGFDVSFIQTDLVVDIVDLPFDLLLSMQQIIIAGSSIGILIVLYILTRHTQFGRNMRAVAEDVELARLSGIRTAQVSLVVFALATAIAMASGSLLGPVLALTPDMGSTLLILVFSIVVVGGLGSIPGAVIGALLLGVAQSLVGLYLAPQWISAIVFSVLVLVLLVRPYGLFGWTQRVA
jgi:branched-chain amino acid transport system permease protein